MTLPRKNLVSVEDTRITTSSHVVYAKRIYVVSTAVRTNAL
jgi:hypothetical protein